VAQYALYIAIPWLILMFFWFSSGNWNVMYPACALTLLVPLLSSYHLNDYQMLRRERMAFRFRTIFNFEPSAGE
jgi:hypothetical protein